MGHRLDIRQIDGGTCAERSVLSMLTMTLDRCPSHALGQHHPSHHGVQPVLVLHNAILRSSPPRGNQEGNGQHRFISVCGRDARPATTYPVSVYATLAGAHTRTSNTWCVDLLPGDMKHRDRFNAEHHHPMLGETRINDVFCPTLWQGHPHPSQEPVGRPPRPHVDVRNPCTSPNPELPDRRMRPTTPYTRHDPPSARPSPCVASGIPNRWMVVST
jgi:hypothetical protein